MWCRTLLTAIAISYLICVLWLSGLQKEDLDVNMLRKLQRHNVNIDDMNSERLRKECLNYKLKNTVDKITAEEENRTEATRFSENNIETRKILKAENDEMSQMIKSFDDNQKTVSEESSTIKTRGTKINKVSKMMPIESEMSANSAQETIEPSNTIKANKSETMELLSEKGQLSLNSVIQFWQKFSTANTMDDIDTLTTSPKPNSKLATGFHDTVIQGTSNLKDFGFINSFFINLINKNTKISSTTTTTTSTSTAPMLDLNNLSQQIKTLMKLLTQNNKSNNDNADEEKNNKSGHIDSKEKAIPHKKEIIHSNKETEALSKKTSPKNIHEMLMFNDRIKKLSIISNEINKSNDGFLLPSKLINNESAGITTHLPVTITTSRLAPKQTTMLSKDIINEIAENVKAIVLKDLQLSIASSTTLMPQRTVTSTFPTIAPITLTPWIPTTTESAITEELTTSKPEETKHVIEKFMELFEQLKTIKDKSNRNEETIITKNTTIKTSVKNSNPKFHDSSLMQMSAPMIIMDTYRIKKPPEMNPIIINPTPMITGSNVPYFQNMQVITSNVVNPFLTTHESIKTNEAPIIQTNLEQIPPLGIPMLKPSIVIHQNIIVTTKQPRISSYQPRNLSDRMRFRSNFDHSSERERRERFYKYLNSKPPTYTSRLHPTENNNSKDYFKFSSRFTYPRHTDDINLSSKKDRSTHSPISFYKSQYETISNNNDNEHYHERHSYNLPMTYNNNDRKRERFHEQLEKNVDWHEDNRHVDQGKSYDRNKLNVISRQQKPLGEIKKTIKYDDSHFQNFLHSQQKVNDMLERILASKTTAHEPPLSVEIV